MLEFSPTVISAIALLEIQHSFTTAPGIHGQALPRSVRDSREGPVKLVGFWSGGHPGNCIAGNHASFHKNSGNPWRVPAMQRTGSPRGSGASLLDFSPRAITSIALLQLQHPFTRGRGTHVQSLAHRVWDSPADPLKAYWIFGPEQSGQLPRGNPVVGDPHATQWTGSFRGSGASQLVCSPRVITAIASLCLYATFSEGLVGNREG